MPVCHRASRGINETPHLVTVKWPHAEDTVRWETVRLCQACLFDPAPLWEMINHAIFCSSKFRSCLADKTTTCHPDQQLEMRFLLTPVLIFTVSLQQTDSFDLVHSGTIWPEKVRNSLIFFFQNSLYSQLNLVKRSLRHLYTQAAYVSNV